MKFYVSGAQFCNTSSVNKVDLMVSVLARKQTNKQKKPYRLEEALGGVEYLLS